MWWKGYSLIREINNINPDYNRKIKYVIGFCTEAMIVRIIVDVFDLVAYSAVSYDSIWNDPNVWLVLIIFMYLCVEIIPLASLLIAMSVNSKRVTRDVT